MLKIDPKIISKATIKAEEVLQENFIRHLPIDPFEIGANYGLKFSMAVFSDSEIAGYFDANNKEIVISARDPINKQVFTAAHELGHYLLEHSILGGYDVLYKRPLGSVNDPIEQEADAFALELLIPRNFFTEEIKVFYGLDQMSIIEKMANKFQVSKPLINYRMHLLELDKETFDSEINS